MMTIFIILFILVSILGWSWWPLGLWWPWWIWLFINDSHDDHVYPYIQLGFEPGDDHDNHIHHHLFPGFDSGEDHDDHDNKDDHNTFHFGYEPGDEYGDHDHDNNDNHIYHNLHLDYNRDDHDGHEYHGHHLWVISKMKTMIIMVIINIPRISEEKYIRKCKKLNTWSRESHNNLKSLITPLSNRNWIPRAENHIKILNH